MKHFVHDANISCLRCQMKPGSGGMLLDSQNKWISFACNVKRRSYFYTHTYYHIIAFYLHVPHKRLYRCFFEALRLYRNSLFKALALAQPRLALGNMILVRHSQTSNAN
jgi:hypothetical protein